MKLLKIICTLSLILSITGCKSKPEYQYLKTTFSGPFDTVTTYIAYAKTQEEFDQQVTMIKEEMTQLDQLFDKYTSHEGVNNIKTINDNAGIKPVKVDQVIIDLLEESIKNYHTISSKVNIAMGSVLDLWHDSRENAVGGIGEPPTQAQLEQANQYTNINNIMIDKENSTVYISDVNTKIDVGATAKGYAVEIIKDKLIDSGVESFLLSAGGNVAGHGTRKLEAKGNENLPRSKKEFLLGIETPNSGAYDENYPAYIIATDVSVVTSGDYQRNFVGTDGKVYNHLIDPDTLYPATYFRSVSIVTEDSGYADFLSSVLFLTPFEEGKAFVESLEGVEAIWLLNDGTVEYSSGLVEGDNFYKNQ